MAYPSQRLGSAGPYRKRATVRLYIHTFQLYTQNDQIDHFDVPPLTIPSLPLPLQAAAKTNDTAGDGTTTATILAAAIIAEGMKIVAAGANPVQLTRGIDKTVIALVAKLKELSTEVTDDALADVATVSAGNNRVVRVMA